MISIDDFAKLYIRVGKIIEARINEKALKPAFALRIDFGDELGIKGSSAQLSDNYTCESLMNRQILAVVNLPPRRVAGFNSEVLVLAVVCKVNGIVLVEPESHVELGQKIA